MFLGDGLKKVLFCYIIRNVFAFIFSVKIEREAAMSESYVECLIKTKKAVGLVILRYVMYVMVAVFLFLALSGLGIIGTLAAIASAVGGYYIGQYADIEYEYLYLDRELTIDKVIAQSKRKRVATYSMSKVEIMAPCRSYRLDNFGNANQAKVLDYSIGYEEQPDLRYTICYEGNVRILISPSDEMVKAMKNANPRKVFSD